MVTKYKLLLLCTVFVVHNAQLNGSDKSTKKATRTVLKTTLPTAASAAAAIAGDADGDAEEAPAAKAAEAKASAAESKAPSPVAAAVASGTKAAASVANVSQAAAPAAVVTVSAPVACAVPAGSPTPAAVAAATAAVLASVGTSASATCDGAAAGKKAEEMTVPAVDARKPHLPYGRTDNWLSSGMHKMVYYKANQLRDELKPIPKTQRFDSTNIGKDALFVASAALEAAQAKEYALIAETVPLLVEHANWGPVVNETARHAYREAMRQKKKQHIQDAVKIYNAKIKAAQEAYEKTMAECSAEVSKEMSLAREAHEVVLKTYDLGGDSDIDETSEEYSNAAQFAGVKVEALRGIKDGELIISKALKIQRKLPVHLKSPLSGSSNSNASATAAAKA